ncbi:MAG: phosphoribosylanthranilate isomerase [Thiotrichaceae bacterium]
MARVKICGITSIEDALQVVDSGADAIGLVFYKKSSRYVTIDQAVEICDALPPFITVVALFMNASSDYVHDVIADVPCDLLQFHGDESPEFCSSFSEAYIKAVAMGEGDDSEEAFDFTAYADQYSDAKGFLIDGHAPGEAGGSGKSFDWQHIPLDYPAPIILAGGLNPDNVASALEMADVYAVDVSSGVESAPGVKDATKIQKFMQEVRSV